MNCNDTSTRIGAYADGETHGVQRLWIRRHLRECGACAARHDEIVALRARLRANLPRHRAPVALRARVQAMADAMQPRAQRRPRAPTTSAWNWAAGGAFAGCAATMLAWFVATTIVASRDSDDIVADAVASHVHATVGHRPIQVASSDQHTVKPWLSARLDYSPPVKDFASDGFTLLGGRIDTLDGRPVATLVYRHGEHTIDVFVRPQPTRASAAPRRTLGGFDIARATGLGMEWLAVSDVDDAVLSSFVQRLARESDTPTARE